jgi:hypothetical protein
MHPRISAHSIATRTLSLLLLAGAAFLISVPAAHAQKVLRYQFRPGEKRDMLIDQDMRMTMGIADQNIRMQVKQNIQFRSEVTAIGADGAARINQRVTRVNMASTGIPGADFRFDSQSNEEPKGVAAAIAPIFRAMMAGNVTLTMTPQGAIQDITLPEEMLAATERAAGLPGVSDMLSKETLTQMMKESAVNFPLEGVRSGQSWTETLTMKTPVSGTQTVNTTYTYLGEEEVDGRVLDKIGIALTMEFGDVPAEVQLKITEQDSNGVLYFDNVAGEFVRSNLTQKMKMDVTAGENAIKQTIETDVKVTNRPVVQP